MLPRSAVFSHCKPGVAPSGVHVAPVPHVHFFSRNPYSANHAAATDVAPTLSPDDLLRAAAARAQRQQQQQATGYRTSINGQPVRRIRHQQQDQDHEGRDVQQRNGNSLPGHLHEQLGWQPQQHQRQLRPRDKQQQQQQFRRSAERQPRQWQQGSQHHQRQQPDRQYPPNGNQPPRSQQQHVSSASQPKRDHYIKYESGSDQDWSLPTGLAVTWLGTSSGAPSKERNVSCTLVRTPGQMFMVDCGEGTHRQATKTGLKLEQVDTIFITHLHGDHCFGIGSMLVSLCRARRAQREAQAAEQQQQQQQQPLYATGEGPGALRLVGPPKLGELVAALLVGGGVGRRLDLPLYVTEFVEQERFAHDWQPLHECSNAFIRRVAPQRLTRDELPHGLAARLSQTGLDWQNHPANTRRTNFQAKTGLVWRMQFAHATVTAAQLQHRVPCWGYVFDEVPTEQQQQDQQLNEQDDQQQQQERNGNSSSDEGDQQQQEQHKQRQRGRKVLILGDTVDSRAIAAVAYGADLVSHEATFAQGMEAKAAVAQHSTAWMAGQFASAIKAKLLVLTHFSARYGGSADGFQQGSKRGGPEEHRLRAWQLAEAEAEAKAAEEKAVRSLQREAEEQYTSGPILLASDLFTVHVPEDS